MKDEIKEILDYLKNDNYFTESPEYEINNYDLYKMLNGIQTDKLLDYITNLQQEINKLTAESTEWESKCYDLQEENEDLKDYLDIFKLSNKTKQETIDDFRKRVDKAIEYIKANRNVDDYDKFVIEDDKNILLGILNGGDE